MLITRSPRLPDFRQKCAKEAHWIESWSNHEPALMRKIGARSGDGSDAPGLEYNGMALKQTQFLAGHMTGKKGSTFSITTAFEREPREQVAKISSGNCWDVRILCKAGQLKDAVQMLNHPGIQADSNTYVCLLEECINMKDLGAGKQVHSNIIKCGFKPNTFLLNTLVNMYAKCGSIADARLVFDKMPERTLFTWTIMMAEYARHGFGKEAFKIYDQMRWEGVTPDKVTFICILNACASLRTLEKGRKVHADILKSGIASYVNLENTLIDMYAKCGSSKDARQVFNEMAERDVVSWSTMIAGYAQHGCGKEAVMIYEQMEREGVMPNSITFICVLNACASLGALEKGKEVHADIIKSKICSYLKLDNTLVDMYAKCGSMKDAHQVFDNMVKRNVVSWNTMITGYTQHGCGREAFKIYEQMRQEGVIPNRITFTCVLNACASLGALEEGKKVHADITKSHIAPDLILETALADMYAKCGSMRDAREVFDKMVKRDVVSWNAMIAGYTQQGSGREAFDIYEQMQEARVMPNRVTFICLLNVCASLGALEKGKEVHADIVRAGLVSYINLENALVDMYAKCGSIKDAQQVFNNMSTQDVVSWNAMITGYAQLGCGREAFDFYQEMQRKGVMPDTVTFTCILNACSTLGALEKGKEVHADIVRSEIAFDVNLETALIEMYAKCGSIKDARHVFDNMAKQDLISCSVMLAGCAQHGFGREALQLFEQMQQDGLKPNAITFISLLSACSHVGLLDEGRHYFDSMSRDHGITPTVEHFGCIVNLLGRAGRLDEAEDFMNKMPINPDAGVWRALLGACRNMAMLRQQNLRQKTLSRGIAACCAAVKHLCCSWQFGQQSKGEETDGGQVSQKEPVVSTTRRGRTGAGGGYLLVNSLTP